ncbi:MAG: type IV toxin-antitoxin system AbiEi family antitoxin domain-containing protein [Solirubrobacteraceae bacterium]
MQERARAVAELARRQHGVVAKRQLIALGVGAGAIKHRLGVGRLHRVHAGVYALGHLALAQTATGWRPCWRRDPMLD